MKNFYLLIVSLSLGTLSAQNIEFSDPLFKQILLNAQESTTIASNETPYQLSNVYSFAVNNYSAVDINGDGEIQISEAEQITYLDLSPNSGISSLSNIDEIQYFTNLVYLDIDRTSVTTLDMSSNSLLKQISAFSSLLEEINVTQNPLLKYLNVRFNNLENIDVSQNTDLVILNISNNNDLESLDLSNNPNLANVSCFGMANLNYVNLKNGNYESIQFHSDFNLEFICADNFQLASIQNSINDNNMSDQCFTSSYCSFTPGGEFVQLLGNAKFDINDNGCEIDDINVKYLKLNISNNNNNNLGSFYTDSLGHFNIPLQVGNYEIEPTFNNPSYFNIDPTIINVTSDDTGLSVQDFCITPNGVVNNLKLIVIPLSPSVPGFEAGYKLLIQNVGNQISNGDLSFYFENNKMNYLESSHEPNMINEDNLQWNIPNILPFESFSIDVYFDINTPTNQTNPVNAGDILTFSSILNLETDVDLEDNSFNLTQVVVNSFDPNDINCIEGEVLSSAYIGKYLTYKIRFENTGTINAENIVVKSTLNSNKFDINSIRPLYSDHNYTTKIYGNTIEFIFENINLPYQDELNTGFVVYQIKTRSSLPNNSLVHNQAEIYFDYNYPIITNNEETLFTDDLGIDDIENISQMQISPNPVKDFLKINTDAEIFSIEIYDIQGKFIQKLSNNGSTIYNVEALPKGMYLLKMNTIENQRIIAKFIKQ